MADLGYLEAEINSLPAAIQPTMLRLFRAFIKDIRLGHPNGGAMDPMLNMGGTFLHGTTPAVAGNELALAHNLKRVPYLAWSVLRLDTVGSKMVPLTVNRAADSHRVYVTSTSASAPISLAVEG